ncbi:alpha/beta hydrolase fold domain-containing protein [Sneathiella sp. P13V-1]|uniref:alpha/beta hydrolase n=1 Tax=Sneathiella sp. P13V-1 TaxID=2697366 RepID=UPI00187B1E2D|nr:alpha/beta hydrolase [Sneathiella sp. P13V-1]MBE7636474.1 alpha/beta hydrolase fold domain-containing protein [Sneathiella sp. P13V-1]
MTLDPQAKWVLDIAIQNKVPPLETMNATEAKAAYEQRAQKLCLKDVPIGSVKDFEVPGPNGPIPVRLYKPVSGGDDLPVLVFFHGGGWVIGSRDSHDALCRQVANEGEFAVLSVDYRMGPEFAFPAAPEDCFTAYQWTVENISSYGLDASRIAVGGDSAGGNLSAVVSLMARDKGIQAPVFQWLIYPATDAKMDTASHEALAEGYFLTRDLMKWFQGHYLQNEGDIDDWRASPLQAVSLADLPPALIQTAGYDPLKDEAVAYCTRMNKEGSTASHTEYPGMIHGFINLGGAIDQANEAIAEGVAALQAAFRT